MSVIRFIDLFCGVGGIRLGMQSADFKCAFSADINTECQRVYTENFGDTVFGDITKIDAKDVPDHEILCAGFPCQPFSISGLQRGFEDTRGTLFFDVCRILAEKKPKVVLLENVKNLVYHDHGHTLEVILNCLKELNYTVTWTLLNAVDFGVPQNRERFILIGVRGQAFDFGQLQKQQRVCINDFLDKLTETQYLPSDTYTLLDNPKQQPHSGLIFAGYLNKNLRKTGIRAGTEHLSRSHKQPYRIYSVLGTHPALSSQETSGRYYILTTDKLVRKLSLSECWRIMGFPAWFKRTSAKTAQYRQVGNSVCVPMIAEVASAIKQQIFT